MDWAAWWALGLYFATLLLPFVMLFVVPGGRKPSSAIAWLLIIAILPWVGFVLFLVLAHPRLPRQRRRRLREMQKRLDRSMEETLEDPSVPWLASSLDEHADIAAMSERLGALPPFSGNQVEVLSDYGDIIGRMVADIDAASRFVHVQSYIFARDEATRPLLEGLRRARERDVAVRVLLDHIGSNGFAGHRALLRELRQADVKAAYMLPFIPWQGRISRPDLRNHRKILVTDGDVGYVGSLNLVDRHYRKLPEERIRYEYLEVMARVRGPVVQQLDAVFRGDWYAETGRHIEDRPVAQVMAGESLAQVLPSGPGHPPESNLRVFNALLYSAKNRIVIVNAYFVPDETLMMALTSAAQRGVEVHIITPEKGNQFILRLAQRSFYAELLQAGVHIHLHPRPWNLHSKTITIDDEACIIGSSNLDIRSFQLNLEVSLICYDPEVVAAMRAVEDTYLQQSRHLTLEAWKRTNPIHRGLQNVARLTSAIQ